MKKILAFAGSNKQNSINHKLIEFAAAQISAFPVKIIRLNSFDTPIFNEDIENALGIPIATRLLNNEIKDVDALMISVNEHNGSISSFFKNHIDWLSRLDKRFLEGKKIVLMSTSNGAKGGASALEYSKKVLPYFGGEVVESFSFPFFSENFSEENNTIANEEMLLGFMDVLQNFVHQIEK